MSFYAEEAYPTKGYDSPMPNIQGMCQTITSLTNITRESYRELSNKIDLIYGTAPRPPEASVAGNTLSQVEPPLLTLLEDLRREVEKLGSAVSRL